MSASSRVERAERKMSGVIEGIGSRERKGVGAELKKSSSGLKNGNERAQERAHQWQCARFGDEIICIRRMPRLELGGLEENCRGDLWMQWTKFMT